MVINLFDTVSKEKIEEIADGSLQPDKNFDFSNIIKKEFSTEQIASIIDHTILKADAVSDEIRNLCVEAIDHGFASVCINPSFVKLAKKIVERSKVKVCTVVGFPLGAGDTSVKKFETEQAINEGADEIDMVINIGRLKEKDYDFVYRDISEVAETVKLESKLLKVIIETCYLNDEEKIRACLISAKAGADFVKTSTGFGPSGAMAADVALMKYVSGEKVKVKASGGIRSREDAEIMMSCGASRLGTSSGVKIIKGS